MSSPTGRRALGALTAAALAASWALLRWGTRWGSTAEERAMTLPGDAYLDDGPSNRVAMTRAITVAAPPDGVWPWIAQLGRGAGFYSIDRFDNGNRVSARHLVSWIPEPAVGDATAIGYLREIEPGVGLSWWMPGDRFLGAWTRMVIDIRIRPFGNGSRVIARVSGDAAGVTSRPVMVLFQAIDSVMACRQLLGIRERVEASDPLSADDETGDRDQYQLYEIIYASGGNAGVPGEEKGAAWTQATIDDAPSAYSS